MTPLLENVVNKKNGKVILIKINIDENQEIATQLNIQSIPTVYCFVAGKPFDAFQGVQAESKIESMVDKLIDATPGNEIPKLLNEADELFKTQKFDESIKLYEKLVGMDSTNPKIISGLLRCLIQLKRFDEAKEMFLSLDDKILANEELSKLKKLIDNANKENLNNSYKDLANQVKLNPKDKDLKFKLAENYLSIGENKKGFNELLEIFQQDPNWNENAAKKKLLEYFDLLGFSDPNVIEARKKLSSMIFK